MGHQIIAEPIIRGGVSIHGTFKEKEHGRWFDYTAQVDEFDLERGATHRVFVGGLSGNETRPAVVKKTVVWVGVDETPDGRGYVWERWFLSNHERFA